MLVDRESPLESDTHSPSAMEENWNRAVKGLTDFMGFLNRSPKEESSSPKATAAAEAANAGTCECCCCVAGGSGGAPPGKGEGAARHRADKPLAL